MLKELLESILEIDRKTQVRDVTSMVKTERDLLLVPEGTKIEDMERYRDKPHRVQQRISLLSAESFIAYVQRFGAQGFTSVFCDTAKQSFQAVVDYHTLDNANWKDHQALFKPAKSLQWDTWLGSQGKNRKMNQTEFGYFIEANLSDIHQPAPATMLEHALEFSVVRNLAFESAKNLNTGEVSFRFVKENAQQTVKFPEKMQILIPVFDNHEPILIDCRVRYRVDGDGVLQLWYEFVKPAEIIVLDEFRRVVEEVNGELADLDFYYATSV